MSCQVPVLFLTFNRPQHTRLALERIMQARPTKLYIHSDGARPQVAGEAQKVAEVRRILKEEIDASVPTFSIFRNENQGLRKGVFEALNWFFANEPYGIVLEDDCVPDLTFFRFCEEILEKYKDDEQVMHVGCSNLAEDYTSKLEASYVFSRFSFVWGWAGWRRAWEKMSLELEDLDEFEQSGVIKNFLDDPKSQAYMLDKFRATQAGKNNSWAYAWFYSILKNNGLCVVPKVNLVQNVGVGAEGATNTTARNEKARLRAQPISFPLVHPKSRQLDPTLEQHFFHLSQKSKFRLRVWFLLKKLGHR